VSGTLDVRANADLDPVTTEVIRHALETIVEEMRVSLRRTAYSVVVKDLLDFSCALFDVQGRLLASSIDIPSLLSSMAPALRQAIERWGAEIYEGDVILTNHPYRENAHTNDVNVFVPSFDVEGRFIGFAGTICHHADWGGRVPGTASAANRSVFEEGVMYPAVKLEDRGRPNESVYDIIWANVRHPGQNRGDLRAQLAAARSGERRLRRLAEQYGTDVLAATSSSLIEYSARRTREEVAAMPDGTYSAHGFLDDDGLTPGEHVPIAVTVIVDGDRLVVDFTGTAPQMEGGMNCPIATTRSVVHFGLKCLLSEDIPFNEGCTFAVDIVAPEGSVVNPRFPAAVGDRHHTSMRMADVLVGAMSQIIPERGSAGWFTGAPATIIETVSNKTGEQSVLLSIIGGGAGASAANDGADALDAHMSNCALIPAEVVESTYPLRLDRYELIQDSGGAGRRRGGLGIRVDFRVLDEGPLTVRVETEQAAPDLGAPGRDGGLAGAPAEVRLLRGDEETQLPPKGSLVTRRGDVVSVRSGGGGGYGDVLERDLEGVRADVLAERVSREAARRVYRVDIDDESAGAAG
jgi:N-methylhydantoinase B